MFAIAPYVRYLVKEGRETGILIDKPKTVRTRENIAAVAESAHHQHQFTVVPSLR